jgi:hypothetical protein
VSELPIKPTQSPGGFRTDAEQAVGPRLSQIFAESHEDIETRLASFPRYIRRTHVTRFIALYELFKLCLPVKGSIVECGVYRGFSLMTWAHLSSVLEPTNLTRRIYGFDSFSGFPSVSDADSPTETGVAPGHLSSGSLEELREILNVYDSDRYIGHIPKVHLIDGDVAETIPDFVKDNPHLVVSLLFCDLDLYEPTRVALQNLIPRMPRGAILAFDELDNPIWPGETTAVLEELGIRELRLQRLPFDPYIGYVILE